MKEKNNCCGPILTPLPDMPSPKNSRIMVRCFTCKHFEVCSIRKDYLKTAQLISEVLGGPACSMQMHPENIPKFKNYVGTIITEPLDYFPEKITVNTDKEGIFYQAKYITFNCIQFIYIVQNKYVIFSANYDYDTKEFVISRGCDEKGNHNYIINNNDITTLQISLIDWREEMKEIPTQIPDIINTSAFSARLDCQFYEQEKGLQYEEGIRRLAIKYPYGIPIDDKGSLYHIATYHAEPCQVPMIPVYDMPCSYMPMPYVPKHMHKHKECIKGITRDNIDAE